MACWTTGGHVDGSYSYDTASRTTVITVPDVQSNVCITYRARSCEHDYQETILRPATCTQDGAKTLTCSKCRQKISTAAIPAPGHRYTYSSIGSQITETCRGNCGHWASARISASDGRASAAYSSGWYGGTLRITYTRNGQMVSGPEEPGTYIASITKSDATASCTVTVEEPEPPPVRPSRPSYYPSTSKPSEQKPETKPEPEPVTPVPMPCTGGTAMSAP